MPILKRYRATTVDNPSSQVCIALIFIMFVISATVPRACEIMRRVCAGSTETDATP